MAVIKPWKALLILGLLSFGPSTILLIVPVTKSLISAQPVFQSKYGPSAGEELVLGAGFDLVQELRRQKLSEYQYSEQLGRKLWFQRTVEGAWPIKPKPRSAYVLFTNAEEQINHCQVVSTIGLVEICVRF